MECSAKAITARAMPRMESLSRVRAPSRSVCFTTAFLKSIMGDAYHHIVTYDDVVQEIQEKKVHPDSKLYRVAPQVVCTANVAEWLDRRLK